MPAQAIWSKNYQELEAAGRAAFYSADVRPHFWEGQWMFQALPHRGDWCCEFLSNDRDEVVAKAEQWLAGEMPQGFYSASF